MKKSIRPGVYRHYKGKLYEVIGEAHHSETLAEVVVYKALYKTQFGRNSFWVRPQKMFLGNVIVNGKRTKRFQFIKSL